MLKEREGFEPSMVLLPYRRSRSIPSTSRTPFPDKAKKVIQIKALAKSKKNKKLFTKIYFGTTCDKNIVPQNKIPTIKEFWEEHNLDFEFSVLLK